MSTDLRTHRDLIDFAKLVALHKAAINEIEATRPKLTGYDLIGIFALSKHSFAKQFGYLTGSSDKLQEKFDKMIKYFEEQGKNNVVRVLRERKNKPLVDVQHCVFLVNKSSGSKKGYSFRGENDMKNTKFISGRVDGFTIQWQVLTDWHNSIEGVSSPVTGISKLNRLLAQTSEFEPSSAADAREKIKRSIAVRRGQPKFREALIESYGGKCAITGCDAVKALEAAHILPYKGEAWNHPQNGLLLRADIHTLFDLHLISINPESNSIVVSPNLKNTVYGELNGKSAAIPDDESMRPSNEALAEHFGNLVVE